MQSKIWLQRKCMHAKYEVSIFYGSKVVEREIDIDK